MTEYVLVIKHGALGDIILATGPMQAIRARHTNSHIVLLTSPAFAPLMAQSPYFNEVWTDFRPKFWQIGAYWKLVAQIHRYRFSWGYDLQTSDRSSMYFRLFPKPKPNFSGIAAGCSHRHDTPERTKLHTIERQKQQLGIAGINDVPPPNLDWLTGEIAAFAIKKPYALLVPGGSAHRPEKRWPAPHFIQIANWLVAQGIQPVLLGSSAEAGLLEEIAHACPLALNLCQKTNFGQIANLARGAAFALGNDTGPMHIIAASLCRSVVLFSAASNPDLCAPRGDHVTVLREADLSQLLPERVVETLSSAVAA